MSFRETNGAAPPSSLPSALLDDWGTKVLSAVDDVHCRRAFVRVRPVLFGEGGAVGRWRESGEVTDWVTLGNPLDGYETSHGHSETHRLP